MIKKIEYQEKWLHIGLVIAVVINLILTIGLYARHSDVEKMEILKAGGADNYALLQQMYNSDKFKDSQKQGILAALKQFEDTGTTTPTDTTATTTPTTTTQTTSDTFPTGTLTADQLKQVLDRNMIKGDANAKILWVEYTDFQCPYCIQHYTNGTVQTEMAKYPTDLAFIAKNFPLSFHPNAQKAAEASYCAAKAGGADAYYKYFDQVFTSQDSTLANVTKVASQFGDAATIQKCITDGDYTQWVADDEAQGQNLFAINGTPGNVLINTKTLKYVVIAGAYPASDFDTEIQKLLK